MTATRDDVVLLRLPVRADLLVLARMTAATVASRVGLAFEEIEDLRLAVEELCLSVVGGTASGSVELTFHSEPHAVRVDCAYEPGPVSPEPLGAAEGPQDDLSMKIVEALVDEFGIEESGGAPRAWLRKCGGEVVD